MRTLALTKHQGLGNDFLVVVDPDASQPVNAEVARRLCHRHLGIGADGLIHCTVVDGLLDFRLYNADGSQAEMSGNGMRCMVQAAVDAAIVEPDSGGFLKVRTPAGDRGVVIFAESQPGLRKCSVDMGPPSLRIEGPAAYVDMGNPHMVLRVDDPARAPLEQFGRKHPDLNVELIAVRSRDLIEMRVHERGVGETLACGTGACAAAVAAHHWGLVDDEVTVRQPGGDALVAVLSDRVMLTGPTHRIARIEVELAD